MTRLFVSMACTAALTLATWGAAAQTAPTAIDVQRLGPQVGERVPDFSLRDQGGTPRTLRDVMGPKGAMLVFFRSADW